VQAKGARHIFNQPCKLTQNAYIESFSAKFRGERLNQQWFRSLKQACDEIECWQTDYNAVRSHSSCGRMPPAKFAAQHRRTTGGAVSVPQRTHKSSPSTHQIPQINWCGFWGAGQLQVITNQGAKGQKNAPNDLGSSGAWGATATLVVFCPGIAGRQTNYQKKS